ncbi:Pantoate--beta-alanine ligase [Flavobacterium indicum GPTSA100-9 = DSM 17447]|uniref:Pantothenate synthetase n=1 Tax=Flavobacterium indicum (strain DSM 17447 / CIP 109464 / GPTSA100-9) TaxID=1094466 RepID=H8XRI9_FLAIG|nr:pantoate--beta-alanine ligase [Flavobacterium indicum]CCG54423.1 Pantoate--beta-alanine ligase [Flavobacterium indicum GPTSA100-9 = DSM 17447]
MNIFNKKSELKDFLNSVSKGKKIGFVPTMGALHKGHLSLLEKSLQENELTVLSIFVNPTQFNNLEDLEKYPRTLEKDIDLVQKLSESIIVFNPSIDDIYEGNTKSSNFVYDGLENQMEGKQRPGHFDGVGTILTKLFEIVKPFQAYFGEKDFQQLQIVKKLVEKQNILTKIIGCPIFREDNGLAMSSRNERLSQNAREEASIIYKILKKAKLFFENHSTEETIDFVKNEFLNHPNFELEYFEIADEETLLPCKNKVENKNYRGFIAVFIENIRLIDNISMK